MAARRYRRGGLSVGARRSRRIGPARNGVHFLSFPIPDRGVPASTPAVVALLSEIAGALDRGKNVAVHCRQSIGRAGTIAAGVLIASGTNPEQAIELVSSARGLTIPETPEQRKSVQGLPAVQAALQT